MRQLIEAKQQKEREKKAREKERLAEEARAAEMAKLLEPAKGIVDWAALVAAKRKKKRMKAELERDSNKPDPFNLDKNYNCVKHIQNQFINNIEKVENVNIMMYRKVQACPLRS